MWQVEDLWQSKTFHLNHHLSSRHSCFCSYWAGLCHILDCTECKIYLLQSFVDNIIQKKLESWIYNFDIIKNFATSLRNTWCNYSYKNNAKIECHLFYTKIKLDSDFWQIFDQFILLIHMCFLDQPMKIMHMRPQGWNFSKGIPNPSHPIKL